MALLIVDDDEVTRTLMRAALEQADFTVTEAGDGEEALRICQGAVPDLLISDAVMPRLDGFELCRELRRRPATAHLPILMATGLDDTASIERAYDCGATDFIAKPINWLVLSHRVRYMLRAARAFAELKSNQATLTAAKEAAEAASRAKTNFLAIVGHELRTPLNAIIGFSTLMRDGIRGPLPQNYASYAGIIVESGEHLLGVINNVLDLAKAEENDLRISPAIVDVGEIVSYVSRMLQELARKANVAVAVELSRQLPVLRADSEKLRQILINLMSNSIKFTPSGGRVTLRVGPDGDGVIAFRVEDTGIGIASDQFGSVLMPFGQADTRLERKYDGMGLGLPISKKLVELHGGTLEIESAPGAGTVVTARLPAGRVEAIPT